MSVQRPGIDQQRLLPVSLEHSLNDLGVRIVGSVLVAFAATSWLALLSWQLRESAAARPSKNLLGSIGAGLSDMLVHTIGIAVIFALICPMIWGLEQLATVRWVPRLRLKMFAALGGVLAIAGAISGLPWVPGWPLHGGAGGMVGDLVLNIVASSMSQFGFERASAVPALCLSVAGLWLIVQALGIPLVRLVMERGARIAAPASSAPAAQAPQPTTAAQPAPVPVAPSQPAPQLHAQATVPPHEPARHAFAGPMEPRLEIPAHAPQPPIRLEIDPDTDEAARAFAERFAPRHNDNAKAGVARLVMPALKSNLVRSLEGGAGYRKPSLNLLRRPASKGVRAEHDVHAGRQTLLDVMAAFGVKGEIREARPGPVVTRFEFEPVRGTKISRIIGLSDDFARELGTTAVRVSVSPGRTTIGIEVPNERREMVALRDILESEAFAEQPMQLPVALGKGIGGEPVALDLARMPHMLVAGTTGSGKSVGLNAMILSLLYRLDPSELRLLLIDPKMLELSQYDRIPHLLHPVITDAGEALQALEWAVAEMEDRYRRMAQQGTRNVELYNTKVRNAATTGVGLTRTVQTGFDAATGRAIYERVQLDDKPMPYIVIVIDELADLMVTSGKKVEGSIQRLAQKARAAGIHLVMATQRPSVDVVTGTIKANFPVRISFRVASRIDSRTIINEPGAEQLLGHGDMLLTSGSGQHLRVHGAYVSDDEIERVVEALRDQGEPDYVDLGSYALPAAKAGRGAGSRVVSAAEARAAAEAEALEEMYASAVAVVAEDRKVSSGHLSRRLGIEVDAAAALIERMESGGLVGPVNLFGRRKILMKPRRAPSRGRRTAA